MELLAVNVAAEAEAEAQVIPVPEHQHLPQLPETQVAPEEVAVVAPEVLVRAMAPQLPELA
jgi:hypothetical protein